MKAVPDFSTLFGDLLDAIFEAIAGFIGFVLAAIGELFVSACEAVLGSDKLVVVVPSSLISAILMGSGIRLLTGDTADLVSTTTLVMVAVLFVIFLAAILLAAGRRKRRQ